MNNDVEKVIRARYFMTAAHCAVGQKRKYTNEPYEVHPIEVMQILNNLGGFSVEVLQAALLHDTVEDTQIEHDDIVAMFGETVAKLVQDLTDVSKPEDGSRKERKRIDREHSAAAHPDAQSIKLADLISNTRTIVKYDKSFAKVYLEEKALLIDVLTKADPRLIAMAKTSLIDARNALTDNAQQKPLKPI